MERVGILGATGYTGVELSQILQRHPHAQIVFATSESNAQQNLTSVFPRLGGCSKVTNLVLQPLEAVLHEEVDTVFSCLPHGASADACLAFFERGVRVIDLSADFRLHAPHDYPRWYGKPHPRPDALAKAVYCIPELDRARVAGCRLIANPGCYPTSVLLPLLPLIRGGAAGPGTVVADSKSGVSGAGRKASLGTSFCEVDGSLTAYRPGRSHQHLGELRQQVTQAGGDAESLVFTPHLVPMERGILTTLYVPLATGWTAARCRDLLQSTFADEPFVRVSGAAESLPATSHVARTNQCHIAVVDPGGREDLVLLVSVIDNLIKGASGQAVQNWNAASGWNETLGLVP